MKKIRYIPYGYTMRNGRTVISTEEAEIIRETVSYTHLDVYKRQSTPYPAINSKGNVVQYSVLKELDLRLEISSRA